MKKSPILFLLLSFICSCTHSDKDLEALDKEIENAPEYAAIFHEKCDSLRAVLASAQSDSAAFCNILELYNTYSPNNVDSSRRYALMMNDYIHEEPSRQAIAASCNAIIDIKHNDFNSALEKLSTVEEDNISRQAMIFYYRAKNWVYSIVMDSDASERWGPTLAYWERDSTSADALMMMGNYMTHLKRYDKAMAYFDQAISVGKTNYFKATGNLFKASAYKAMGDENSRKHFLALSAIADLKNNAKEYESLFILSRILNRHGDFDHATKYSQMTVEDAVGANYSSRIAASVQASRIFSNSFIETQKQKHRILFTFIIILSALLTFLLILMLKLNSAKRKIAISQQALRERTIIQDKFLGEYMELASTYIGEVDKTRSNLRKSLREGGIEAVSAILRSPSFADREIKNYYSNFDKTFVSIFPDFTAQVAELTGKDIEKPENGVMTVDLRILALIRLGITDDATICKILHISSWTVYSYMYRMRKTTGLSPKDFIVKIQSLCRV